jgi:two-component system, LytTR family, sensor histidine kinase AlgZ
MHPILAGRGRLALYLALWVLVAGLLAALLAGRMGLSWLQTALVVLPIAAAYAFVCLSAWYVARSLPIVSSGAAKILATGIVASLLSSGGWLVMSRPWIGVLVRRGWLPEAARVGGHESLIFGFGVLLYLLSLAVSYLLITVEETQEAERRALQVQVLAREAELRSLRAQIDPHFLFNCLHSISALTTVNPQAARRMCLLLGDFLRETLALGGEARITVARELKLAERFLAVERIRFGDRLDVEIAAEPQAATGHVPPLLLQPIVENAVTHGIAHMLDGGTIRIVATRSSSRLSIVVENPCDPERPRSKGAGVGLANVRARLRALHGADAVLATGEQGGRWRVEVSFPAPPAVEREKEPA